MRIQDLPIFQTPFFRGLFAVITGVLNNFEKHEIAFRSASLAYYGLLSIFPILLFIVFLGTQFLESQETQAALNDILIEFLPGAYETVQGVIDQTMDARGSIGLISGIALLWSGSTIFNAMTVSLNTIWGASPRPVWRRRLIALILVLTLAALFILSIALSALAAIQWPGQETVIWQWLNSSVGLGATVLLFWVLYHGVPNKSISALASLGGAILAAVLWQGAKSIFAWYLASGFNNYGAIYGSFASVIALVLWVYISALILFVGAELGASLQREVWPQQEEEVNKED